MWLHQIILININYIIVKLYTCKKKVEKLVEWDVPIMVRRRK